MTEYFPETKASRPVASPHTEAVSDHLASLTTSGLPLAAGLRAAADQTTHGKLRSSLAAMANQVEQGRSLEQILAEPALRFPDYFRRLILAAVKTNAVAQTLTELIEHHRQRRELARTILVAVAYPALLLAFTMTLFVLLDIFIISEIYQLIIDFELNSGANYFQNQNFDATRVLRWSGLTIVWTLTAIVGVSAIWVAGARLLFGPSGGRRAMAPLPLIGPLASWSSAAEMAQFLAMMIRRRVPLDEALQWAAQSLSDGGVRHACGEMAVATQKGKSLAQAAAQTRRLPESMLPLLAWGERNNELAEALDAIAEMLQARVRQRAWMLCRILPPIILILVGTLAGLAVASIAHPLLQLINALS